MPTITEGLHARMSLNISDYLAKLKRAKAETRAMAATAVESGRKIQKGIGGAMKKAAAIASVAGRKIRTVLDKIKLKANSIRKSFGGIKGMMLKLGAAIGLSVGLAAVVASAKGMSKAASDFEETASKFRAVFKEFSAETETWVENFTAAVGRSKGEVLDWMARLQDTFVPLGFARDKAAELSAQLTTLGVDLASFNNMVDQDVIENLTSAITGQHIAVRKYGIVLNEQTLNQALWNAGIKGGVRAATNLEKVQARLAIIMGATTDAQGDAIRTAGSFENQMKFVASAMQAVRVELGTELNNAILEFIVKAGGAKGVAAKLKVVLTAVVQIAKMGVQLFSAFAGSIHQWQEEAGGAVAAGLKMAVVMKRIEVGLRFIGHIGILVFQGFHFAVLHAANGLEVMWVAIKTVGRLIATVVIVLAAKLARAVGWVVSLGAAVSDWLGLTDEMAARVKTATDELVVLEEAADKVIGGLKDDWDGVADSIDKAQKKMIQYARDQEKSWAGIQKASQEVMNLTVQADAAQKEYNETMRKASKARESANDMGLKVRLSVEAKQQKERVSLLKEMLREKIVALKDSATHEQALYTKTLDQYKTMLKEAQSAYSKHIGRLNALDREHLQFNEAIEERIFRLKTKNLAPDAQIKALRSAVKEFENRAGGELRKGNFEESRRLLDKAASFLEQMASVDPSAMMASRVASDLEKMQQTVNQIFKSEAQFHTGAAKESLVAQEELKRRMDELTVKQAAWAEQYKTTMLAWEKLGDANEEQLKGFTKDLDDATKKRQVFIEAMTDQAHVALKQLQADIDALHGKSIDITIRRAMETAEESKVQSFDKGGLVGGRAGQKVPLFGHGGEFVVNQAATRNYLPFLRSINQQGLNAPRTNQVSASSVQGGESLSMGDINVTIQSSGQGADVDAVEIAKAIQREVKRGRVRA